MRKNFFSKVASVLSLAMVVTAIVPLAGTAQAASAPDIKTRYTTVYEGQGKTYAAKNAAGYTVKWSVSGTGKKYASINSKGELTIDTNGEKAASKARIRVNAKFYKTVNKKAVLASTRSDVVTIKIRAAKVTPTVSKASLTVGETATLTTSVKPANTTNKAVSYKSEDSKVAAVSSKGVITANAEGTTKITATAKDGSKKSGTVTITVTKPVTEPEKPTPGGSGGTGGSGGSGDTDNPGSPDPGENLSKVRTIVTTDGEVDDMDSFIRLMLYANEMDIAGIVLTSSTFHWAGDPEQGIKGSRWTGQTWINEVLNDYGVVYNNLKIHASGYPTPDYLKSIYKIGNIKTVGDMAESTEGSEFMKKLLLDDDKRDLYIQTWGGTNTTARALYDIEKQYKGTDQWNAIYQKVSDKAILYIILSQDDTYSDYIAKNWPDIRIVHDTGTFWSFAYQWTSVDAALTGKLQGAWMYENIKSGHGPLLEGYITTGDGTVLPGEPDNEQRASEQYFIKNGGTRYGFISEGDSPSFFYLIDNGLRSLENPTYGGWGGRFAADASGAYKDSVSDYNSYKSALESKYKLTRWFNDIQSDFAARADWCVETSYSAANHRPTVAVEEGINVTALPGQPVTFHAKGSDPDGDKLFYDWTQYYEADTYDGTLDGKLVIRGEATSIASFVVPDDAEVGDTIHLIVQVKDRADSDNYMTHYQRVIITVGKMDIETLAITLPAEVNPEAIPVGSYTGWTNPYTVALGADVNNGAAHYKIFTWTVDDPAVAGFSSGWMGTSATATGSTATLVPLKTGTVTVTITANDGSGKTASLQLKVQSISPAGIEVSSSGGTEIKVGNTATLSLTVTPANAVKTVAWTSSDDTVATVDANGKVTAVAAGTVTITAVSTVDGTVRGSIILTVTE